MNTDSFRAALTDAMSDTLTQITERRRKPQPIIPPDATVTDLLTILDAFREADVPTQQMLLPQYTAAMDELSKKLPAGWDCCVCGEPSGVFWTWPQHACCPNCACVVIPPEFEELFPEDE